MGKVGSKAILVRRTITFLHMFVFFHTFEGKKLKQQHSTTEAKIQRIYKCKKTKSYQLVWSEWAFRYYISTFRNSSDKHMKKTK